MGSTGYPLHLEESTFLIEETRFIKYMHVVWGIEITEIDLNVLEFFGLVIPVRKAFLGPLLKQRAEDKPGVAVRWLHRGLAWSIKENVPIEPGRLHLLPIDPDSNSKEMDILLVRPTPVLELERGTVQEKEEAPAGGSEIARYSAADLRRQGLWWRPTDPAFWAMLAWGGPTEARWPAPVDDAPMWLQKLIGPVMGGAFRLTSITSTQGNQGITRFYIIGGLRLSGARRCVGPPGFFRGWGQDWWVAQAIRRLRYRVGLDVALDIEGAMQRRKVNSNRKLEQLLEPRWLYWVRSGKFSVPRVLPYFHRNALLWLAHRSRPSDVGDWESFQALGKLAGLKTQSVRTFIHQGQASLCAD